MQLMNMRVLKPKRIVDINRITSFHYIREEETFLAIGQLVRYRDLMESELVQEKCPMLLKAVRLIGHQAIKNRGTVLGSLAYADPRAELPTVMMALGGQLTAADRDQQVELDPSEFFQGMNQTALLPTQYLREARFPKIRAREGNAFLEFSIRYNDPAIVSAAVSVLTDESGVVTQIRGALGGVGSIPIYFEKEADSLLGSKAEQNAVDDAVEGVVAGLQPSDHLFASAAYSKELAAHLLKKGVLEAYEEAVGKEE